jgi:hypothetical protein
MLSSRQKSLLACLLCMACALPGAAQAQTSGSADGTYSGGGVGPAHPNYRPTGKARIVNGRAIPPADAPAEVKAVIEAGNRIIRRPYRWGGGHARIEDTGYDCSGAISYALLGGGLLAAPLDSRGYMTWGLPGRGRWITVYTNPGHAYLMVAGIRLDTGFRGREPRGTAPGRGPRWLHRRATAGFQARHPNGF